MESSKEELQNQDIYISNAGLVIVAPFLPRYFDVLGMSTGESFKTEAMALRAVHLIQYAVTGMSETEEYLLVFNKILCGLPVDTPVPDGIELIENEIELTHSMLSGIVDNWQVIGNTTTEGFRDTFLNRAGKLEWQEEGYWNLYVEQRSYDLLLDSLPWAIATVKLPWMEHSVHVHWR